MQAPTSTTQSPPRRTVSRLAFLGLLGASAVGAAVAFAQFLKPRVPPRFVFAGKLRDLVPGVPVRFQTSESGAAMPQAIGKNTTFWVVRLNGTDTRANGDGGAKGVVALAGYCTHLGCTVPWREEFTFEYVQGWFRCPCHGATYTRSGLRSFGPAPRGMDAHPVEIRGDGSLYVDRGRILPGGDGPSPLTQIPRALE